MKRAIGYARISSKDQSNWSLPGQAKDIEAHCKRDGIELLTIFTDNGESAKNFDRAEWKDLEDYVKKYHKEIDYLVVVAYDRFSRNVVESLTMMSKLEEKYKIIVISTSQPLPVHSESPSYFLFRMNMLMNAEMEYRVIRDRTKTGMHRGAKDGRYLRKAPIGYINARDDRNKPIIVIDPDKAPYIREIYRLYLQGVSFIEIFRLMYERGFKLKGNSRVQRILTSPVYAGMIQVPKYYDEPEQLTKGLHEAIIEESEWWKVQALMNKPLRQYTVVKDEVPLRNVLKCSCGKPFTAAPSKGKYKIYWYYWCTDHRKNNYSANKIHQQFDELTSSLSLPDHYIKYLENKVAENLKEGLQESTKELDRYKREQKETQIRIDTLEQKYLFEGLEKETYQKYKLPLQNQLYAISDRIAGLWNSLSGGWQRYKESLYKLADLHFLFQTASTVQKQAFINLVFEGNLYYENGAFRTPYILPIFSAQTRALNEKGLLIIEQPEPVFSEKYSVVPLLSADTNFIRLMEWVEEVSKVA